MFREIREWVHLALLYGLLYSTALVVLVLGIVNISNDPPQHTTIIQKTYEVLTDPRPSVMDQYCNRIEGCEVFPEAKTEDGYCPTCIKIRR